MFRKKMGQDKGMLFVFDHPKLLCFWMKNTYIPLSIAFMDKNFNIINIENMYPLSLEPICSKQDALFALEVNQGWFDRYNIKEKDNFLNFIIKD